MLTIYVKSDLEKTVCERELIDDRLYLIIVLNLILFIFDLQSEYSFDIDKRVTRNLLLKNNLDAWGHQIKASPQIVFILVAVGSYFHDSVHCAVDFGHIKLNAVHRIQSFSSLVQRFEILNIFHAVVLKQVSQE